LNHPHDHDHDDDHAPSKDDGPGEYALLEQAMRELLIEKGVITADGVRRMIERLDEASPATGARIVARAWTDSAFRKALLDDAGTALAAFGFGPMGKFIALENTPDTHNVIVCTLCSCYPRFVLGFPPDWYKSTAYRSRVVREPRAVLQEFGLDLPETTRVVVSDSTAEIRYMVVPMRPQGTEGLSEEELAALVHRDALIGTAVVASPAR
jgi:nitrile hydratase alpha subunit